MFTERMALKIRLEQMQDSEMRIFQEFQREREIIMARLRELDATEGTSTADVMPSDAASEEQVAETPTLSIVEPAAKRVPKAKKLGKSRQMHEAAFSILRDRLKPVKGTEIQDYILDKTGYKVANMTTFMKTIQRKDSNVRKLDRGLYIYEKDSQ